MIKATTDFDKLGPSVCEEFVTVVGPNSSMETQIFCWQWSCPKCRQWLRNLYWWKISKTFKFLAGVQVFVDIRQEKEKELSNFLRSCNGPYYSIKTPDGTWVISTKTFPQANRKDKKKFMKKDFRRILDTHWTGGKRVDSSSEFKNLWRNALIPHFEDALKDYIKTKKFTNVKRRLASFLSRESHQNKGYWGMILGTREKEFLKLKTLAEQVQWLADNQNNAVKIYKEGKRVLGQTLQKVSPVSIVSATGQGEEKG
jgi:hypothetical protein